MEYIKSRIRDVYDFPTKGIVFKDLTTVFKDPRALHIIGWDLSQLYRDKGVTKVVGIESRGFIGGSILAFELGAGFVPVRKPGKLPGETISVTYGKEYGADTLEIQKNAIHPGDKIILVDDLIATGSTLKATADLVRDTGGKILGIITLIEFTQLGGRQLLEDAGYELHSLVKF